MHTLPLLRIPQGRWKFPSDRLVSAPPWLLSLAHSALSHIFPALGPTSPSFSCGQMLWFHHTVPSERGEAREGENVRT